MYPFEVWNEEQQRIDFHWDRFSAFTDELFGQYPSNFEHNRIEMQLIFPSDRLEDVWVHEWNPHHEMGNHHLSVYDCFYNSDRWSTIFEVYPAHVTTGGPNPHQESWHLFIEEDHAEPWGEPIQLMSTADVIYNDTSHRYAYFRGKYWKVASFIPCWPLVNWNLVLGYLPNMFHRVEVPVFDISIDQWTIGELSYHWPGSSRERDLPKPNWMKEGF